MFDLNDEIDRWCKAVVLENCAGRDKLEELKDHLHCLVEEHQAEGLDERAAFARALKQMGDFEHVSAAYAGNTNLLQKMAAFDRRLTRRIGRRFSDKQIAAMLLGVSMLFAASIIAANYFWPQQDNLTFYIIALWFIPFAVLSSVPGVRDMEMRFLRRMGVLKR